MTETARAGLRAALPNRRQSTTLRLVWRDPSTQQESSWAITMNDSVAGAPAGLEVFVWPDPEEGARGRMRTGSGLEATIRDSALMLSLALQYGAPLQQIVDSLTREDNGQPSSLFGAIAIAMLDERRQQAGAAAREVAHG